MSTNLNRVVISGRLTKDVSVNETRNGNPMTIFSVGCNYYGGKGEPEGVSFSPGRAFGKTAEYISKYYKKGDEILIDGVLREDSWQKDGKFYSAMYVLTETAFPGRKKMTAAGQESAEEDPDAPLPEPADGDLPF